MTKLPIAASILAAASLAACGDYSADEAEYDSNNAAYAEGQGGNYSAEGTSNYGGTATAGSTSWPAGSRIVVENGVTYRIEPGGARIALGPNDSRVVVEEGTRFRVDPDGTRVRINDEGAVIDVDTDVGDTSVGVDVNTQ